jgi:predicted HTH transcriptional regulator
MPSIFGAPIPQQTHRLATKIERERIFLGDLLELSVKILELARERGRVTIAKAAKATGASRNTIKDHVRALTDGKHLTRRDAGGGAWYAPG